MDGGRVRPHCWVVHGDGGWISGAGGTASPRGPCCCCVAGPHTPAGCSAVALVASATYACPPPVDLYLSICWRARRWGWLARDWGVYVCRGFVAGVTDARMRAGSGGLQVG